MLSSPIYNALLRVEGISGKLPSPFECPRPDLDSWVLELPDSNLSVSDWCTRTTQVLSNQMELLQRAHLAGVQPSLFVEFSTDVPVLRLEATFLRLLADLGIALECAHATNTR